MFQYARRFAASGHRTATTCLSEPGRRYVCASPEARRTETPFVAETGTAEKRLSMLVSSRSPESENDDLRDVEAVENPPFETLPGVFEAA